ncbi:endonuclease/exonuclease/phosphatase family protein [Nafulsella turpanensis]|uniref:endonuclease/exonuclease/phosphatase family protein n=1 Tax=Nafulsella turpanensis TaxID=1265690 RepID=UPI00034575B9|nr:endonuclease/exonuclease/phosphatase family protein [Nafulsella turpanensis]
MKKTLLLGLLLVSTLCLQAQVRIDGAFTDWESFGAESYTEPAEERTGPDLSAVSVTNDEEYVYFYLKADKPYKLHDNDYAINPADVNIYLDTDLNAATGRSVAGIGADLIIAAGSRDVLYINENGTTSHSLNDIGLISLPTATSSEYEIALSREGLSEISTPLFSQGAFHYVIEEANSGDLLPNEGALTYTLQEGLLQNYTPLTLEQQELSAPQIRLITHNVLHDGLTVRERSDMFARIYQALQPDILTLNENWDTSPEEAENFFNTHLPLESGEGWYASKPVYGNITVSRYPIVENWEVFPGSRLAASMIDLPDSIYPRDIVVINSHLRCCDEDNLRQQEGDAIIAFILDAKTTGGNVDLPANTPIVISGDLNLVGDNQQLRTLLNGDIQNTDEFGSGGAPDWDGSTLTDLMPLHTDHPFAYTWYNAGSHYPAGRMDFIIYTNSMLEVQKSFILNIMETPAEKLAAYGLSTADAEASDHLPLVADFTMSGCSSPVADASFSGLPDSVIVSAPALTLNGQPAGGEFWGPGMEGSTFNPSTAGNGVHTIKYTVWNNEGCSNSYSQEIKVTEDTPTGIKDPLLEKVSIVPNPARGQFRVLLPDIPSAPVLLTIYTADGRKVKQQELSTQQTSISLNGVPAGLLFIQMNTRKGQKAFRLLKENK